MGRGLSQQQKNILAFLAERPQGHTMWYGYSTNWNEDSSGRLIATQESPKERKQRLSWAVSQSRALHRLAARGLVEKFFFLFPKNSVRYGEWRWRLTVNSCAPQINH